MEKYIVTRGNYNVACYSVPIDEHMRELALDFAKKIILSDNQYSRLLPEQVRNSRDISMKQKIEIQRTYMGKLGELAFLKLLLYKGKEVNTDGMLEVFEGQENVDSFDFETASGQLVDVKTGFRDIHTRLLVNIGQFDHNRKDFYVAVKLNAVDVDSRQKLVDWNNISTAEILGYAEGTYMLKYAGVHDFGEDPARWLYYDNLLGIDRLINMF